MQGIVQGIVQAIVQGREESFRQHRHKEHSLSLSTSNGTGSVLSTVTQWYRFCFSVDLSGDQLANIRDKVDVAVKR